MIIYGVFLKYNFNTILLYMNVNFDIPPIVTSCFKVWQVHNPSVYGVFVVATSAARAAELLVAQCPVSLITRPMLPGALTTHNLVAYHLPSSILWRLRHYQLTWWRCHTNDSCWWSYEPAPFFNWNSSFMYPPPGFLVFTCLGFTSFEAPGQRSVDFPCHHSNSQHHQMSRELVDHNGARQRALLSQPLPSGEQRRQDRRGENIFC